MSRWSSVGVDVDEVRDVEDGCLVKVFDVVVWVVVGGSAVGWVNGVVVGCIVLLLL